MNSSFAIRRSLVMALAAGGMSAALAQRPVGLPDNYPNKPVRIIIASSPGGASDTCGRVIATGLSQRWGSAVIAENVTAGGTDAVAYAAMMRAAPDGHTLMITTSTGFASAELVEMVPLTVRLMRPAICS